MKRRATIAIGAILFIFTLCAYADDGDSKVKGEDVQNSTSEAVPDISTTLDIESVLEAAKQGSAAAQFELAVLYYSGEGVQQNYRKSAKWFRKAAEQGDVRAQKSLAVMYGKGRGVNQSHERAYIWASVATKYGDNDALYISKFASKNLSAKVLKSAEKRAEELFEDIQKRIADP
jgi:hypothetical protein